MSFQKTKFKNGLDYITWPGGGTGAVTVLIMFKVGSRYESKSIRGISHFIEHMMFKGTKKRPTSLIVSSEMDGIGAEFNAFTSKNYTGYYIKAAKKHLPLIIDLLSDILINSKFDQAEIEKERGVIMEELKMYEDNPLMHIGDLFEQTIFGPTPLGDSIIGTRQTLSKINRAKIIKYFGEHYQPANMTVAIAGSFNATKARNLIRSTFGKQKRQRVKKHQRFSDRSLASAVRIKNCPVGQVQIAMGVPAYPYGDPRLYPLGLMSIILGEGMSSRLWAEIRDKRGLAYYVKSHIQPYEDTGAWAMQAGVLQSKTKEAIKVTLEQLDRVRQEKVSAKELKNAKENIKGHMVLNLEDSYEKAQWLSLQNLFYKKLENVQDKFKKIDRVTSEDIQKVARDIFRSDRLNLAMVGPVKEPNKFKKLLKL